MATDYVPPQFMETAFNCPHCGAYAHQYWRDGVTAFPLGKEKDVQWLPSISASFCVRCKQFALWDDDQLFYPQLYIAPQAAADMPDNAKEDYNEARAIFSQSPRGAAALLRLAIQKLVVALGESGDHLNQAIGNLVKKGLRENVQKALDVVRVVGNNAVHPGVIDIQDNPEVALSLFKLVNLIVEQMITEPKKVEELFNALPEGAKDAIAERDKETSSS